MSGETGYESPGIAGSGAIATGLAAVSTMTGDTILLARSEASATQRAGESELDDRRNQLRADALVALSALGDARRRVRLYENDLLPLARQAVENTVTGYQGGSATLLELIDSQRSQLGLELEHWRARADAAQQQIVLQTLVNQPL